MSSEEIDRLEAEIDRLEEQNKKLRASTAAGCALLGLTT